MDRDEFSDVTTVNESPPIDLFTASALGYIDVVLNLVQRGQSINEQNNGGFTALMYACAYHRNQVVMYLLNLGADIALTDPDGKTFISLAAEHGNQKALTILKEELLSHSLRRNRVANNSLQTAVAKTINLYELKNGLTPLMTGARLGLQDIVSSLLELGADKTLMDSNGRTARDLAVLHGHRVAAVKIAMHKAMNITVEDILVNSGLEKYKSLFARMTLDEFLLLEEDDLKNMGIKLLGPRKTLLMAIGKI
ncbi:Ankyrin repeat and sterile alpha motif domain containing 3 [Nesidiocoris tenuis]|uniref:Ankyrin repeat and sterile alpha motif domain containing 3 n=1 Tax=Nesidiocoris tenuis TaxID=355587 RepID=A0ABN7AS74_9HEMI|nr:Ankyrin repeat and sterile alpha motif domain containing 3 [Nesidiocoris tenuis]